LHVRFNCFIEDQDAGTFLLSRDGAAGEREIGHDPLVQFTSWEMALQSEKAA
jgi:hypothetical protein